MGKRKRRNENLVNSRQLYRMIAQNQDLPMEIVQDVLDSLVEVVYVVTSEGYKINVANLGVFNQKVIKGHKKGDTRKVAKLVYEKLILSEDNNVKFRVYEKDGEYFKEYLVDEKDCLLPNFKFHKSFKEDFKERSKKKWQQQ